MPLHPSAFAFGLTVIAMLLGGQVFNAQADQESHDDGPEFSANVSATDDEDWKGQSVDVVGARVVDVQGQVHRLGFASGVTPFVIVFIDEQCPISTRYALELNRFSTLARDSGLTMFGGTTTVIDFEGGLGIGDQLDVSAFGFANFAALLAAATASGPGGHDTLIQLDGDDSILLEDFELADLNADDVIL
jgi:hypothetical protein